jgi:hypothetical protein
MTTARSPLRELRAQSDRIANLLKAAERGEAIPNVPFAQKVGKARRTKDSVKFVVAMDDKFISIEMPWATIRDTSEVGIAEYILKHMREARDVFASSAGVWKDKGDCQS